jgi:membrane protein
MESSSSGSHPVAIPEAVLSRLPMRLRTAVEWAASRWPGRIFLGTAAGMARVELFDRAMTIAAQFFTSVFPILITLAVWAGAGGSNEIADAMNLPDESRSVLDDALGASSDATFGILGTAIVLISATSLSRALTRAFAAIWELPRPRSRLSAAWRWFAAVLVLALSVVVVRSLSRFTEDIPPQTLWHLVLGLALDLAVAIFVPWVLLAGAVHPRSLFPGALLFAVLMVVIRPSSALWLPHALEVSADRYGTIGVAFTYIAWLYVVSFCFVASSVVGQVIATDHGPLGRWIRGRPKTEEADAVTAS